MPFMTIPEAAVLWHTSAAELRQLCEKPCDSRRGTRASALVYPGGRSLSFRNPSRILNLVGDLSMAQTDLQITAA